MLDTSKHVIEITRKNSELSDVVGTVDEIGSRASQLRGYHPGCGYDCNFYAPVQILEKQFKKLRLDIQRLEQFLDKEGFSEFDASVDNFIEEYINKSTIIGVRRENVNSTRDRLLYLIEVGEDAISAANRKGPRNFGVDESNIDPMWQGHDITNKGEAVYVQKIFGFLRGFYFALNGIMNSADVDESDMRERYELKVGDMVFDGLSEDFGTPRSQVDWEGHFKSNGRNMASMADFYKAMKEIAKTKNAQMRDQILHGGKLHGIVTGTNVIIHKGSDNIEIADQTVQRPRYRKKLWDPVDDRYVYYSDPRYLSSDHKKIDPKFCTYLQALLNTDDDMSTIKSVFKYFSDSYIIHSPDDIEGYFFHKDDDRPESAKLTCRIETDRGLSVSFSKVKDDLGSLNDPLRWMDDPTEFYQTPRKFLMRPIICYLHRGVAHGVKQLDGSAS